MSRVSLTLVGLEVLKHLSLVKAGAKRLGAGQEGPARPGLVEQVPAAT